MCLRILFTVGVARSFTFAFPLLRSSSSARRAKACPYRGSQREKYLRSAEFALAQVFSSVNPLWKSNLLPEHLIRFGCMRRVRARQYGVRMGYVPCDHPCCRGDQSFARAQSANPSSSHDPDPPRCSRDRGELEVCEAAHRSHLARCAWSGNSVAHYRLRVNVETVRKTV